MLNLIVGNIEISGAIVLSIFFIGLTIVATVFASKFKPSAQVALEKDEMEIKHQETLATIASNAEFKLKQLDQNLITSHRSDG